MSCSSQRPITAERVYLLVIKAELTDPNRSVKNRRARWRRSTRLVRPSSPRTDITANGSSCSTCKNAEDIFAFLRR